MKRDSQKKTAARWATAVKSSADPQRTQHFFELLAATSAGRALQACSDDQGRVVAEGATAELLNDEALMLAHGLERPHILRHRHPH